MQQLFELIRQLYDTSDFVPLHAPQFTGNEKNYLLNCIDSGYVSSVGEYVSAFEHQIARYTEHDAAVACVTGTAGLQAALHLAGVKANDLVITQSLSFIATCNAIHYLGASPVFVDIDEKTLGLSPKAMAEWLDANAYIDDDHVCRDKRNSRAIKACLPMHTFGHSVESKEIRRLCDIWNLIYIDDMAEALGSRYQEQHSGQSSRFSVLSFNGNKVITTGGGGMVLCSQADATKLKYLTTTAKQPHPYEYIHEEVGYNFRMPNLNAALGLAQLERLPELLANKRQISQEYKQFCERQGLEFVDEPEYCQSNFWLNGIICESESQRTAILEAALAEDIMLRPVWRPIHTLAPYRHCDKGDLSCTEKMGRTLLNLPSSAREVG